MRGKPLNRHKSAAKFRHRASRTKAINKIIVPTRGGYRL